MGLLAVATLGSQPKGRGFSVQYSIMKYGSNSVAIHTQKMPGLYTLHCNWRNFLWCIWCRGLLGQVQRGRGVAVQRGGRVLIEPVLQK